MQIDALSLHSQSAVAIDAGPDLPPAPTPRPVEWRRAMRALRELLADPNKTEKAFEIFLALDGDQEERGFQRFYAHPTGHRLLAERPQLLNALSDRDGLQRMRADSFGRAYLEYLERTGLNPSGLVELKDSLQEQAVRDGENGARLDPAREWFRTRTILMHDLWHVLTGYDTDEMGEAALLPFSFAQMGGRANGLLTAGVVFRTVERAPRLLRYLYQAWQRGRRAAWLVALPYETLLPQPLDAVRAVAAILPGEIAHPGGILRGRFD